MKYVTRHDRLGTGKFPNDTMIWRAKQLVTAGYSSVEIAAMIGCTVEIADAALIAAYPELQRMGVRR